MGHSIEDVGDVGLGYDMSMTGFGLIDYIEVVIGDQVIDRHTGEWLHIYNELFVSNSNNIKNLISTHDNVKTKSNYKDGNIYIPLNFWFNKNPGLALPLICLRNADVRINVKFNKKNKLLNLSNNKTKINCVNLLCEYIHLSKEERNIFLHNEHSYLIEQVQSNRRNNLNLNETNHLFR